MLGYLLVSCFDPVVKEIASPDLAGARPTASMRQAMILSLPAARACEERGLENCKCSCATPAATVDDGCVQQKKVYAVPTSNSDIPFNMRESCLMDRLISQPCYGGLAITS